MKGHKADEDPFVTTPFSEDFSQSQPQGHVVGSRLPGGAVRQGRDAEHQISIDHGILRFRPLITPGWGREGISYGPFRREPGLTFAISMTNGHNASQGSAYFESFPKRVARWMVGPNADPVFARAFEWLRGPRKRGTLRRLRWWAAISPRAYKLPFFNQNLAVGWFSEVAPISLDCEGNYFVMNSAEENNGDLWARVGEQFLTAVQNVKNIRLVFLISLREYGAIYYVAAVDGAQGFGPFPKMRPIAIDPFNNDQTVYAGVHQCALGQIGWRSETLIHDLRVETLASRVGTAHVSDTLTGRGDDSSREHVADWFSLKGEINFTKRGAVATTNCEVLSVTDPGVASGLLHGMITSYAKDGSAGLVWRMRDASNYCMISASRAGCTLHRVSDGIKHTVAQDKERTLTEEKAHSLQIIDGFGKVGCYLDGNLLFGKAIEDAELTDGTGVGLWLNDIAHSAVMQDFEAHPREVDAPIRLGSPSYQFREGSEVVLADGFSGDPGDLAGCKPDVGDGTWERTFGRGRISLTGGEGARVSGSIVRPHPNRTLYTLPWANNRFCDLEVTVTPPGSGQGDEHRTRAGIVFWQDPRNYLTISPWQNDSYPGSSISVFPKRHGFEELYDAVWTNVGKAISWARPFTLRCQFNGDDFLILLNGEPVMERALSDLYPTDPPLCINRVGLATNWEWGSDTGSVIGEFIARH